MEGRFRQSWSIGKEITDHLVQRDDWDALRKRISRAGGDYARIETAIGNYRVFTDAFQPGIEMSTALTTLSEEIASLPFDRKRISTSRGWKMGQSSTQAGRWERVASLAISLDKTRIIVESAGLETLPFREQLLENLGWKVAGGFDFTVPDSWLEDGEQGYQNLLEWLKIGEIPSRESGHEEELLPHPDAEIENLLDRIENVLRQREQFGGDPTMRPLRIGQLVTALEERGARLFLPLGRRFDPTEPVRFVDEIYERYEIRWFPDLIFSLPSEFPVEDGMVTGLLSVGCTMNGRVIREAQVIVFSHGDAANSHPTSQG